MPPNYSTTARLGFRYPSDTPTPNVISDFAPLMATMAGDLDTKVVGYSENVIASRPAAGISNRVFRATDTGLYYFDTGTTWSQFGGTATFNAGHTWALGDDASPSPAGSIVASFPIYPAGSETPYLIGVAIKCTTVGATPSVFKIQTDHAAHGTLADVTGLTGLTPATGAYVFTAATGGPIALSSLDEVAIVASTPGNSKGIKVAPITAGVA